MENESMIFSDKPIIYASFWERFAASFVDGIILIPISYGINYFIAGSLLNRDFFSLAALINYAIAWLYSALQESGPRQATVGKRAMGIKVTDETGSRISFGRATGRHFGKYLSMLILFIGYLMMLWDTRKQTLHDKLAGTLVVTRDSGRSFV